MKAVILLAAVLAHLSANGALIGNLGTAFSSVGGFVGHASWAANGFQTHAGDSYTLDSVVLRLNRNINGSVHVYIAANSINNSPGTILSSLGDVTLTGYADYTFRPQNSVTLAPETKYWVVVSPGTTAVEAYWTGLGNYTQTGADWIGGMSSGDAGNSWSALAIKEGMQINASPVPEPATTGFYAIAFLVVCCAVDSWKRGRRSA